MKGASSSSIYLYISTPSSNFHFPGFKGNLSRTLNFHETLYLIISVSTLPLSFQVDFCVYLLDCWCNLTRLILEMKSPCDIGFCLLFYLFSFWSLCTVFCWQRRIFLLLLWTNHFIRTNLEYLFLLLSNLKDDLANKYMLNYYWSRLSFWVYILCRPSIKIPAFVMMPIAHAVEWTYKLLAPYGMNVPQLTPSRIRLLSCSRTFNCSKAKDQLGYTPVVSLQVFSLSVKIKHLSSLTFNYFINSFYCVHRQSSFGCFAIGCLMNFTWPLRNLYNWQWQFVYSNML